MSYRPQVTEANFQKKRVLIDPRKKFVGAFKNPNIKLFLPTDQLGNATCPTKACRMECWTPDFEAANPRMPGVFESSGVGLSNAVIKLEGDDVYASLVQSVALSGLTVLNGWLKTMKRTPEGDIHSFEVFIGQGGL